MKLSFLLFNMIEEIKNYLILFTESKNVNPSQTYCIFKSWKYVCLHCMCKLIVIFRLSQYGYFWTSMFIKNTSFELLTCNLEVMFLELLSKDLIFRIVLKCSGAELCWQLCFIQSKITFILYIFVNWRCHIIIILKILNLIIILFPFCPFN